MKKSILKSSIALAVAGVFGATVAVTAAEPVTPMPVTQEAATTAAPAQPVTAPVVPTTPVAPEAATTAVTPQTPVAPVVDAKSVTPAVQDTTPVPTATQDIKTPVAEEGVAPSTASPAPVPTIETASVAKVPSETKVVRVADKKADSVAKNDKEVKNTKKAAADKAPKAKAVKVKDDKKADKEEATKEEKKTLKVENHNIAQPTSKQA